MTRLLLLFIAVVASVLFVHWLLREDPKVVAAKLRRAGLWILGGALILLAVTGRLHWLFALAGALAPFFYRLLGLLRFAPLASQLYSQYQNRRTARAAGAAGTAGGPDTSHVRSRYLRMTLDHDSGEMDGEILDGEHRGRRVSQLALDDLLRLLAQYRNDDADSAALLQAYLDRYHAGWEAEGSQGRQAGADSGGGAMTPDEAGQILGISPDASRQEVIEAHRRLMQKLHPDRGGSDYLAAKINQAKDLLLGE